MENIKNILWATDLSESSGRALPQVASLSSKYGARVHLVYVAEDVRIHDHLYGDARPELLASLQVAELEMAEKLLNKLCHNHLQGCPAYVTHLEKGNPAREILRVADEEQADIIVMTTRGRGGDDAPFSGSVTEKVVRHSPIPVLTVNPG